MAGKAADSKVASILFLLTLLATLIGVFAAVYYLYVNVDFSIRIASAVLVGIVGILSFFRHSVYYKSDQARMGWTQEHPEFQFEVGYANLATGLAGLAAAILNWGALACGMTLLIYGIYMLCNLLLHAWEAGHISELRPRATRSVINTGLFVVMLLLFATIAFGKAGVVPALF